MPKPTPQPIALVINDDPSQLHVASAILSHDGFEVIACPGAEQALNRLSERPAVDVIVTDLYMPGIDGWHLCRLLRSSAYEAFNRVPIVVLSATFSGAEAEEITAQLGADAFLPAPYEPQVLREVVRDLLGNNKPRTLTRVLIVEPNPAEAELLADNFKANGYAATRAATGAEALDRLRHNRPQIVILEAELPDASADRLLERVKEPGSATVAIVITTDASAARALDLIRKGADNCVPKPFAPAYLLHLCETALRQRALTRVEELLELRTRRLRDSEQRYRSLFENANVAIAIFTVETVVLSVNRAFEALIGKSRDELIGKPCQQFLTPAAHASAARAQNESRINKVTSWVHEAELLHADGSVVPVEAQVRFLRDPERPGVIMAMYRDLTAERQLQRQRAEFSAMLAHDIRNPVGLILGCAALLLDETGDSDPALVKTLHHRILDHAHVLQTLVNNYLDVSTLEAGQVILNKRPVQLGDVARRVARRFEFEARQREIRLQVSVREDSSIEADALAIERIIVNLLQNALKFTPTGGLVALSSEERGGDAVVTVRDTGPGIDPKKISCLFKKFKRIEVLERQEGLGLGLYIVKELVEAHGGRVEVESVVGRGSSFSIFFPLSLA